MDFLTYHLESSRIRDIDPANDCLLYLADRFELSLEQRYWIAFLYSTCYCAPTVFYIYNEFPDYENVNVARLQRWWDAHKHQTIFQTDRLRIKTGDKFVETFESYKKWIGDGTQAGRFSKMESGDPVKNYQRAFNEVGTIKNVGRFTLFLYLEMISVLTNFKCIPDKLDWKNADNCRVGLCYATEREEDFAEAKVLDNDLDIYVNTFKKMGCEHSSIFNVETTLCAYKKFWHGKRYIGYYIDRQGEEIKKMKALVPEGVCWRVLDEFRDETYEYVRNQKKKQPLNLFE